jgi:hypothetical protein
MLGLLVPTQILMFFRAGEQTGSPPQSAVQLPAVHSLYGQQR